MSGDEERHSKALEVELIADPEERAKVEASNGLKQFDAVAGTIEQHLDPERPFRLRPSVILSLHRIALQGISAFAGVWRPVGIEIGGSQHKPPGAHLVAGLVEELCDYINDNWNKQSALHLCAYILWRLNWIHPFVMEMVEPRGLSRTLPYVSSWDTGFQEGIQFPNRSRETRLRITGHWNLPTRIRGSRTPTYLCWKNF